MLRIDSEEGSVQCPDTRLTLKCSVLKQASSLSTKENTTVRVPIPVPFEVHYFGVYAVPGLPCHVFVGPFTNKDKDGEQGEKRGAAAAGDREVIDLESPPPERAAEEEDDDDDEVQEIPPPVRKNVDVSQVVGRLVESLTNKAVAKAELNRRVAERAGRTIAGKRGNNNRNMCIFGHWRKVLLIELFSHLGNEVIPELKESYCKM